MVIQICRIKEIFLREITAEKGDSCRWKFKLEFLIVSRMLSNVLEAIIVTSELISPSKLSFIFIEHMLPQQILQKNILILH